MAIGSPATLFTITTAIAPASCAARIFVEKLHVPREINAIFPARLPAGRAAQARPRPPVLFETTTNGAVKSLVTTAKSPLAAPAVSARAAEPGDSTVSRPGPLLPAATATTILA